MRKNFFSILTLLVAIFAVNSSQNVAAAVTEPTLTQLWKFTESLPDDATHKDGAGIGGEFYLKSTEGSIDIWGETGNTGKTIATGTGGGIATDEAGNIIVRAEYFAGSNPSAFQIIPAGTTAPQALTLTLAAPGRVDHLACASGDILSAEGGKLYLLCTGKTAVNVITIKEGVQTECVTVATSASTGDATSEAYPVIGDAAAFLTHVRGAKAIYKNDGAGNDAIITTPDINSTAGSCMFQIQGVNYIAYNSGDNYSDGFSIANMETGEKLATHANETNPAYAGNATTANHISYEAKDENTVYVYVYTPGNMIAKYEFEVPAAVEPTPDPETYDPIYLIGEVNGNTWGANVGVALETADGIVYTDTVTFNGSSDYSFFAVATVLGATDQDWDTLNANRYGPANDRDMLENDTETIMNFQTGAAYQVQSAEYVVTVNMTDKSIKVVATGELPSEPEVTYPETLYLIGGGIEGIEVWNPEVGLELAKVADTKATFTAEDVVFTDATSEWKVASILASWDDNAAYLYGAAVDAVLESEVAADIIIGGSNFKAAAGKYDITIDLEAGKVTLVAVEDQPTPEPEGPTFTQDWALTTGLPDNTARDIDVMDGKVYIQDVATKTVTLYDENGAGSSFESGSGFGIAFDDAGNLIVANNSRWNNIPGAYKVFPKGSETAQDMTIAIPDATRNDYLTKVDGDILSAEGGALYFYCTGASVTKVTVKSGVPTEYTTIPTSVVGTSTATAFAAPWDKTQVLSYAGGDASITLNDCKGNEDSEIAPAISDINKTSGFGAFELGGSKFIIYNFGTEYADGFKILNAETGELVATHEAVTAGGKDVNTSLSNQFIVKAVSETAVEIYVYTTGYMLAKYTFEVPAITPTPEPHVYPENIFLIGSGIIGVDTWDPAVGFGLFKVEGTEATYYEEAVEFTAETSEWKIAEVLGSWDDNKDYLYGATEDAVIEAGVAKAIANGGAFNIKSAAGIYNITIDLVAGTVLLEEYVAPVADRAIFAYNLKSHADDSYNHIAYSLNTAAESVQIIFKDADGKVVSTIEGTTNKGENSVAVAKDAFIGQGLTWEVKATGAAIADYTMITPKEDDYAFYAPYGVSVDNNPESANFGNVYVVNSGDDVHGAYSLVGLAAYTPDLVRYSAGGANIFTGGITARHGKTGYDFRKVKVMADGSIVIASDVMTYSQLYKTTFAEIANDWTAMFEGTQDTESGIITDADGATISSPIAAMAVEGAGADQKIWTLNGYYLNFSGVSRYDIGEAATIATAPAKTYAAPEGQIMSLSSSMLADGLGGYWVTQYRAAGNNTQPSIAHYNAEGVRDYVRYAADTEKPNLLQNGGIAINMAGDVMALGNISGSIALYNLAYDAAGVPSLTYITEFDCGIGSNINEIAFDYAGNIHAVSNSGEWYAAYAGKTDDNTSTVPAAAAYTLDFAEPIPADRAIFAYGLSAAEDGDNYVLAYSLNTDATSVEITVKDAEGNQVGETIMGGVAKGDNTVTIAKADYAGDNLSWEVKAAGTAIAEYAKITPAEDDYAFYAPYGVDVDNNPESDNFGWVYVTNTGDDNHGAYSLVGVAAYAPNLERYEVDGANIFNGGITARTGATAQDFRKVKVLDDGSIIIGSATQTYNPMYITNLSLISYDWAPLFAGELNAETGDVYNAEGEQIASSVLAMDVIGSGADQELWVTNGFGFSFSTVRKYNIGYKGCIGEVADVEWAANENMINYMGASMVADGLGGYWGTQYRAVGNDTEPNLVHYNAKGELDLARYSADTEKPNMVRQGGIAIKDNLMALAGAGNEINMYNVVYDAEGAPTLTFIESFTPGIGYNINEIAFDYAGNIHTVSNSGEWYAVYSGKTDNNESTVKCSVNNLLNSTFTAVAPEIKEITTSDEGYITINWEVEGATPIYYVLSIDKDGEAYKVIDAITETSVNVYLTDIAETTTFEISVTAIYANGDAEGSESVEYTYQVSGVESIMAAAVSVYPNPTVDVVTINSSIAMNSVEVYSTTGALVAKVDAAGEKSVMVDVAAEAAGIYFIKIDGAKTIKVIKK